MENGFGMIEEAVEHIGSTLLHCISFGMTKYSCHSEPSTEGEESFDLLKVSEILRRRAPQNDSEGRDFSLKRSRAATLRSAMTNGRQVSE